MTVGGIPESNCLLRFSRLSPYTPISATEPPELQLAAPCILLYTGMTPPTLPRISRPVRVRVPCLARVLAEIGHSPLLSRYPVAYNRVMVEIRQTDAYARWFRRLRDRQARVRIDNRIRRLSLGNPGDVRPVGEGVSEIRIDYGPGYRVYFAQMGEALVVLLAGGDKDSQERDIRRALELARGL